MPQVQGCLCPFRDHLKHSAAEVGSGTGCVSEIQPASSSYKVKQIMESEKEACKCFFLRSTESLWSRSSGWFYAWWFFMFLHTVMIILFFILATYDCGYINTSILKFAHNLENTLLFICVLFAKWFRSTAKTKISFCFRRNIVSMDYLLER